MKMILCLLPSSSLWAQSVPTAKSTSAHWPLVLTVTGGQGPSNSAGETKQILGYLSDDPHHRPVPMACHDAILTHDPDGKTKTYPASYGYGSPPHNIKIFVQRTPETSEEDLCVF
jgi:hypothetical protein